MSMSRENMAAEDDAIKECSDLHINAKGTDLNLISYSRSDLVFLLYVYEYIGAILDSCKGPISMEQAAALSCYPFMNPSLFNFHNLNTHGA
jgi:hypothetical protein